MYAMLCAQMCGHEQSWSSQSWKVVILEMSSGWLLQEEVEEEAELSNLNHTQSRRIRCCNEHSG